MPVLDASVLVEYLTGGSTPSPRDERIASSPGVLWAPYLVDAEVGHALRRAVEPSSSRQAAREALGDLREMRAAPGLPRPPCSTGLGAARERQLLRRALRRPGRAARSATSSPSTPGSPGPRGRAEIELVQAA